MNWTAEQKKAIELRNKNILVAAAAGSGKTAVLVERIKRLMPYRQNADRNIHQCSSRRDEGKNREGYQQSHQGYK